MRIHLNFRAAALLLLMAYGWAVAAAEPFRLTPDSQIVFATEAEARKVLGARDAFIEALSPFDRAARLKTEREVAEPEFLEFVANSVQPWSEEDSRRVLAALEALKKQLEPWKLAFPAKMLLIKTSGREEGNAAYTRQNAIVLPAQKVMGPGLKDLLAHEMFHILSRSNPNLRQRLYAAIGFSAVNPIEMPPGLRERKITNPDGVESGWSITITNAGKAQVVTPVLYSSAAKYDPAKGGEFFNYLNFRLMALESREGRWIPKLANGEPVLLEAAKVSGFFEQVGRNTSYIIHPDEILASNFVPLINGQTGVPTPQILERMKVELLKP